MSAKNNGKHFDYSCDWVISIIQVTWVQPPAMENPSRFHTNENVAGNFEPQTAVYEIIKSTSIFIPDLDKSYISSFRRKVSFSLGETLFTKSNKRILWVPASWLLPPVSVLDGKARKPTNMIELYTISVGNPSSQIPKPGWVCDNVFAHAEIPKLLSFWTISHNSECHG